MVENRANEIERFKRDINLVEYAEACGYAIDRKESSRNSTVMRRGNDKIVVATDMDGHGIYFSTRDERDNGTIIDFVQCRQELNLGQVRKLLRPWMGESLFPTALIDRKAPAERPKKPERVETDRVAIIVRWQGLELYRGRYLQESRGLSDQTIRVLSDRIRLDQLGNICFRHGDKDGISGWEMKNVGFTGFAKGGKKALFATLVGKRTQLVVITESAIDAMSYHELQGRPGTLYLSTAGTLSDRQRALLRDMLTGDFREQPVILGMDADEQGQRYCDEIMMFRPDAVRHEPERKDWNEDLKAVRR